MQLLAGLDQREGARGVDAQRLEHLGRQHLAHAALERQAAVAGAAPRRRAPIPWCRGPSAGRGRRASARRGSRARRRDRDCSGGTGGRDSAAPAAAAAIPRSGAKRPKCAIHSSSVSPSSPTSAAARSLRKRRIVVGEIGGRDRIVEIGRRGRGCALAGRSSCRDMGRDRAGDKHGRQRHDHAPRYEDGWWTAIDGLRLHYRDYPGGEPRPAADPVHPRPHPQRARFRARGGAAVAGVAGDLRRSARARREPAGARSGDLCAADPIVPTSARCSWRSGSSGSVLFGTSLGGLIAMLMALHHARAAGRRAAQRHRPGASMRRGCLGSAPMSGKRAAGRPGCTPPARSPRRAATSIRASDLHDWLAMAKRLCRLTSAGRIVFDYDMKIAEPIREAPDDAPRGRYVAGVRGAGGAAGGAGAAALSDLLSAGDRGGDGAAACRELDLVTRRRLSATRRCWTSPRRSCDRSAAAAGAGGAVDRVSLAPDAGIDDRLRSDRWKGLHLGMASVEACPRSTFGRSTSTRTFTTRSPYRHNPAVMPVRILHLHSTFSPGGKETRAVRLMNAFGAAAEQSC